jgi:hypothetical protein
MKVKENVTVYQCEYCKKKLFVRGAMGRHEKWCTYNPENFAACSGCDHLEETRVAYTKDGDDGHTCHLQSTAFRCKKLDQMVYPKKVEKKGLLTKYPETFKNQIPMPKECIHHTIAGLGVGDKTKQDAQETSYDGMDF